ncbi:hypothetical protein LTR57_000983 [Friedmanniomyces endolithicus]|uniref:Tautomerase cis-CaaD-like domain-containing protein n=1 Tax=Friedmanniomyces endolithicus TaxID=329885 RepID=A0AAN6FLN0_9PEZI|nr:hypothetical protein LTS09_011696 [Friedmanniomyces endolithicus]KAK0284787.1 hypothetical protein LTR35_005701 [Friedmanniomyces endolithicus]KAK0297728.1 hypothetical protein LTS00_003861 [Friedmanniomyces endolithicus]KAK0320529.1 hypothetical protein LTR82_008644 [Friedmanniomyces endolithicus]KAK0930603.1 hypothetical protein LTR57_000983 [Friedmanniomyces endolithicus]
MPFYEFNHHIPLTISQKDELAAAITTIHSTHFSTPKLFVNVAFHDVSQTSTYIAGKRRTANHLSAHVRNGPSRGRKDWAYLVSEVQAAWDKIVGPGLPKVPPAGGDVQWLQENWGEFNRRAEAGDEDFKGMVEEVKERKLMVTDGMTAQQKLEEALGWGDSA